MAVEKKLVKIEHRINGRSWAPGEFVGAEFNNPRDPELDEKKQPRKLEGDHIVAPRNGGVAAGRVATAEEAYKLLSRKNFPEHGYSLKEFDRLHKETEEAATKGDPAAKKLVEMHAKFAAGEAEKATTEKLRANYEQALLAKYGALAS